MFPQPHLPSMLMDRPVSLCSHNPQVTLGPECHLADNIPSVSLPWPFQCQVVRRPHIFIGGKDLKMLPGQKTLFPLLTLAVLVLWAWITLPSDATQNVLSSTKICTWMGVQGSTPGLHVKSHVVHGKQASAAGETWQNHNKLCDAISQEGAHMGVKDCPALSLRKETDCLSACQLFP